MKRVVVGLSGGVDSSVAAWLLQRQGYDVVGLFMRNWHDTTGTLSGDCPWEDDRIFAELVAKKLDIPFHFVDLSEQYRARVVDYMFAEYERGRTPNPDVLCNREIKFDVFLQEALKLGADAVATGHYCRVEQTSDGRYYRLLAGVDPGKDQSYFLCQLSQDQLSRAMFPIGGLLKSEVRRIAEEQKLATAKRKDSQGICFVGKVDLPTFLQQKLAARRNCPVGTYPVYVCRSYKQLAAPKPGVAVSLPDIYYISLDVGRNYEQRLGLSAHRKSLALAYRVEMRAVMLSYFYAFPSFGRYLDNIAFLRRKFLLQKSRQVDLAYKANPLRVLSFGRCEFLLFGDAAYFGL
jgi:PP-loop superfamily ATP-utilizing enzyme